MTGFYYSTATNLAGPWQTQPLLDINGKELLTGAAWDDPVSCPLPNKMEDADNDLSALYGKAKSQNSFHIIDNQ